MADNTRVPLNRIERIIAFAAGSALAMSIGAIIVIWVGRAANADFTSGVLRVVIVLPLPGLALTLIGSIAYIIVAGTRRNRLARDAGQ